MERRALLAAVLSLAVFLIWNYFFTLPPLPPLEDAPAVATSAPATTTPGDHGSADVAAQLTAAPASPGAAVVGETGLSAAGAPTGTSAAAAAPSVALPREEKTIDGKLFQAVFTTEGGGPRSWKLKEYTTYHKMEGALSNIGRLFGFGQAAPRSTESMDLLAGPYQNALPFGVQEISSDEARYKLVSSTEREVVFQRQEGFLLITKRYQLDPNAYLARLEVSLQNVGTAPVSVKPTLGVKGHHVAADSRFTPIPTSMYFADGKAHSISDSKIDEGAEVSGQLEWAGVNDKYFLRAVVLPTEAPGSVKVTSTPGQYFITALQKPAANVAPGQTQMLSYQFFLGPKRSEVLEASNHHLIKALDFGTFGVFAEPLLALLKWLHGFLQSWGLSIIVLTIIIKTLFYPLMAKQMESAQRMKEFQPEMAALREKYKDDRNKLNQEMMRFMQEKKINPLGGCLPMLLQMPIWFALYSVLQSSIELYHTPFLYLPDLSEQDPYGVSPAILGALMFIQQKMTPPAPGMDPAQAKMMQYMPLIFAFIMFSLPSGLVVYILVNTILTIIQQWFITRKYATTASRTGAAVQR